ncbi:hypothetical protein BKA83DRAFT_4121000 [Pisolithus microcarpus]|nr:hypothetical protein BKA83DRAFT_4121000 [Pisolithus microcarpus]
MIEPTHPVIFRVFSPPPCGLQLERDDVPERNSGARGEEHNPNLSCNTSVMMIGQMLARCIRVTHLSEHSLLRFILPCHEARCTAVLLGVDSLNSDPNSVHDLPGAPPPLSVPVTGLVPATSEEFCKHQKAIRSRNDRVSWFSSMDSEPIGAPSSSPKCYSHALQDGDLFTHTHSHGCQAWIWGEPGWMPVQEAGSGEPSWVMGKTMSTYRAKNRKCRP